MNSIILSGMARIQNFIAALKEERGQDLVEYAVLVGGIGIVAAIALIGANANGWLDFGNFKSEIQECISFNAGACGS